MSQNFSIDRVVSGLVADHFFNEGGISLSMRNYLAGQKVNRDWMIFLYKRMNPPEPDPNWLYYLARDLQEQTGERVHPGELYGAISDPSVKEKTNPPLMFQENYFRILGLNEESDRIMKIPEELVSIRTYLPQILLYAGNEMGYDALVQHDRLSVAGAVRDLVEIESYVLDPDDRENLVIEKNRGILHMIDFKSVNQIVGPILPSEKMSKAGDYIEGVYRMADKYVEAGKDIMEDSPEFSGNPLDSLSVELSRLAESERGVTGVRSYSVLSQQGEMRGKQA